MDDVKSVTGSYNFGARQAVRFASYKISILIILAVLAGVILLPGLPMVYNAFNNDSVLTYSPEIEELIDAREYFVQAHTPHMYKIGGLYLEGSNKSFLLNPEYPHLSKPYMSDYSIEQFSYYVMVLDDKYMLVKAHQSDIYEHENHYVRGFLRKVDTLFEVPLLDEVIEQEAEYFGYTSDRIKRYYSDYAIDTTLSRFNYQVFYILFLILEAFILILIIRSVMRISRYQRSKHYLAIGNGSLEDADRVNELVSKDFLEKPAYKSLKITITKNYLITTKLTYYMIRQLDDFHWFFPVGFERLPDGSYKFGNAVALYLNDTFWQIHTFRKKEAYRICAALEKNCPWAFSGYSDRVWELYNHNYKQFLSELESNKRAAIDNKHL